jgi:hypothetical protein
MQAQQHGDAGLSIGDIDPIRVTCALSRAKKHENKSSWGGFYATLIIGDVGFGISKFCNAGFCAISRC